MSFTLGLARGLAAAAVVTLTLHLAAIAGVAGPVLGLRHLALGALAAAGAAAGFRVVWHRGGYPGRALVPLAFLFLFLATLHPSVPSPASLRPFGPPAADAFVVALFPALALSLGARARASDPLGFLLGAALGVVVLERGLLPAVGFGPAALGLGGVGLAMEFLHGRRRRPRAGEHVGPSAGNSVASDGDTNRDGDDGPAAVPGGPLLGWAAWGALAAAFLALVRPFALQYLPGTREGSFVLTLVVLLGLVLGGFVGRVLLRGRPPSVAVGLAVLVLPVGLLLARQAALRAGVAGAADGWSLPRPGHRGAWVGLVFGWTALGPALLGLGLPLAALRTARSGGTLALLAGGVVGLAGVETLVLPRLAPHVEALVRHDPRQPLEGMAVFPGGIATRWRTQLYLAQESAAHWNAGPVERGTSWARLERAESDVAVAGGAAVAGVLVGPPWPEEDVTLTDVGRLLGEPPFGTVAAGDPGSPGSGVATDTSPRPAPFVLHSVPFLAAGAARVHTRQVLQRLVANGLAWVWFDPRSLTADGLRTLLATWRVAVPDGTLVVLHDTYSGPLLGLGTDARVPELADLGSAASFVVALGPISELVPEGVGEPATQQRPALVWECRAEPSPFPHASPEVLATLRESLVLGDAGVDALLRGLEAHAAAQAVRGFTHEAYARVEVPTAELEHYLAGLRAQPDCAPLVLHLERVAEVLHRKKELALLLTTLEEACLLRPDVPGFHRWLGYAYGGLLDYAGAAEELELALALDPGLEEARVQLASALLELDRTEEAIRHLRPAWDLDPDNVALGKALALALESAGHLEEARETVRYVLVSLPEDRDLREALERLESP